LAIPFSVEVSKPNNEGDTLTYYLNSIDIENYAGINRNVFSFSVKSSNPNIETSYFDDKWIEGLGSIKHPFYFSIGLFSPGYLEHNSNDLLSFYENDVQLFQKPNANFCNIFVNLEENSRTKEFIIIQNPFQDEIKLSNRNGKNLQFELYNFSGQKIEFLLSQNDINITLTPTQNLDAGIYFLRAFENNQVIASEKLMKF